MGQAMRCISIDMVRNIERPSTVTVAEALTKTDPMNVILLIRYKFYPFNRDPFEEYGIC